MTHALNAEAGLLRALELLASAGHPSTHARTCARARASPIAETHAHSPPIAETSGREHARALQRWAQTGAYSYSVPDEQGRWSCSGRRG